MKEAPLQNDLSERINSKKEQTFLKKLDPPKFSGDCLDYLEWKTKWASVVSTCE